MLRQLAKRLDPLIAVRLGRYEQANVETLRSLVRPGDCVWDIGANIGQMTYVLSKLVGPAGHVLAVEPGPRNADTLRRTCRKRCAIIEAAVSDRTGYAHFSGDGRSDASIRDDGALLVRTVTLDELAGRHGTPGLVKMDIEGHEHPAFRGAARLLADARPILVVEFHGQGLPDRDIDTETRDLVASYGYRWERPHPTGWYVGHPA